MLDIKKVENRPIFKSLQEKLPSELFSKLPTPAYIIEESQLLENGKILKSVMEHTGCKILLAQKAFSNFNLYPLLSEYIAGTEASGLYEARLGAEEMSGKEVHVFCGAYRTDEFEELLQYADHIVFNSVHQLKKFGEQARRAGKSVGLRINPECSTQEGHAIYDPCAPGSRLGVTREVWDEEMTEELFSLLDGLHFHTLCEQDAEDLYKTLLAVEERFGDVLPNMKWLNMGGGHHITKQGYDIKKLEQCIRYARQMWNLEVYLEPGEAVALNAGYFAARVLDIVKNGSFRIAILDASAACHMPDVMEMPYTPPLFGAETVDREETDTAEQGKTDSSEAISGMAAEAFDYGRKQEKEVTYQYRLAGPSCLSGDIIGDYKFKEELQEGDLLLFGDMAIYTTCKNNTFNGMPLPDIWKRSLTGELSRLTGFGYQDFKMRLGTEA